MQPFAHTHSASMDGGNMTTLFDSEKTCGVCGTKSTHTVIGSTNSFGSSDLDLRPPPMKRDTMPYWLDECPKCHLVCEDLESPPEGSAKVIATSEYLSLAKEEDVPDLCRIFRAWSYLADQIGMKTEAATSRLHSAWAADDVSNAAMAKAERIAAAARFSELRDNKQPYPEQKGTAELLIADLWRRAENWPIALKEANNGCEIADDPFIKRLCVYEARLIESRDTARHTVEEVGKAAP
jgi:hypothetical protein